MKMADIIRQVAEEFGVLEADITARAFKGVKTKKLSIPRGIAMGLCHEMLKSTYPEIGRKFGGRHHTSALNGHRAMKRAMAEDENIHARVNRLRDRIQRAMNPSSLCQYCGGYHVTLCPTIKSIEYHADGRVKSVVLRDPPPRQESTTIQESDTGHPVPFKSTTH